jgi:uncharacterized protein YacL
MKKYMKDFVHRGLASCGFGPLVLAVIYLVLQGQGLVENLTVNQVCTGIFSITALAFLAGSMNAIYQIERLPLTVAILIHGIVLYVSYLVTYLLNGWLNMGTTPILVFTIIFVVGYLAIWAIIYSTVKKNTDRVNELLKMKQNGVADA